MKLIVGLGNPGKEYELTRHNMGFMFIDNYANHLGVSINNSKFNGLYCNVNINGESVILLKPQSFINLSGEVVLKFIRYFKIRVDDILVISDDLDLSVGKYRLKCKGSSGGHNGLKNIEYHLDTDEYKRLKIGISNDKLVDTKDYVLGKIGQEDMNIFNDMVSNINNILDDFCHCDFSVVMRKYNRK